MELATLIVAILAALAAYAQAIAASAQALWTAPFLKKT
jgi:hypothetical protein